MVSPPEKGIGTPSLPPWFSPSQVTRSLIPAFLFKQSVDHMVQILTIYLLSPSNRAFPLKAKAFRDGPAFEVSYNTANFNAIK
jgi:hypothetical protein